MTRAVCHLVDSRGLCVLVGLRYRLDHDLGLTIIVGDGVITAEEWRAHISRMTSDPEWPPGRLVLGDLSSADLSAITGDDIRAIATGLRSHDSKPSDRKGAIVAGETAYRASVTFQQTTGPTGRVIMIFPDIDRACEWLAISTDDVAPTIEEMRRESGVA